MLTKQNKFQLIKTVKRIKSSFLTNNYHQEVMVFLMPVTFTRLQENAVPTDILVKLKRMIFGKNT